MSCMGALITIGLYYCDFNDDLHLGVQSNDLFNVKVLVFGISFSGLQHLVIYTR